MSNISDQEQYAKKRPARFVEYLLGLTEPHTVRVGPVEIEVDPGVFPPTTESQLLAAHIPLIIKKHHVKRVLDLSTGSGASAIAAGRSGAKGIASDINPMAVANARRNFERHSVDFQAVQSDLFTNIPKQRFDLIIANLAYIDGEVPHPLYHAVHGTGWIDPLFSELPQRLSDGGRLLAPFAEWGKLAVFEKKLASHGLAYEIIARAVSDDGERAYRLYEIIIP